MVAEVDKGSLLETVISIVIAEARGGGPTPDATDPQSEEDIYDVVSERVRNLLDVTPGLVHEFEHASASMLRRVRAEREIEAGKIGFYYGYSLDLLELQVALAMDTINYVLHTLLREQAGALSIAAIQGIDAALDVHALISAGRPRGAYVRWRSCHEAAVTSGLLLQFGPSACERYLAQIDVDNYKDVQRYQEVVDRLNDVPYSDADVAEAKRRSDLALEQYPELRAANGWAREFLPDTTFRSQEKAAGLDHLRPHYVLASHHGHAGPKGGVILKRGGGKFVVGPSTSGIPETLSLTAASVDFLASQFVSPERHGFEVSVEADQFACLVAVQLLERLYEKMCGALEDGWAGEQADREVD